MRLRTDEKQRQRLYHSSVPFGKDTDTNTGDVVQAVPASACGPSMGPPPEHPSKKYQGFGKSNGPIRFTRTGRVMLNTPHEEEAISVVDDKNKIRSLADLVTYR